ncbi:uncharacterized protein BP01DRAFT_396359 [Aspergillus saccharolyticus JOP 1030-1]|uniref:C2H2-type domain-containing protein n=1 Tax=Aspergillus saccharolyticus JOP 1030-1 TaxID=1450539 RepID=A0A318ZZS3_9EURO|nr:hypothetical protein BP01DRAFT_396359 [Aspergillus saccharolyticus JOP 1030-1]PYH49710.1 hypothetical protein BP01DRAFT_396359 [Aspergillus saccharolyticus JOP 1030-1]
MNHNPFRSGEGSDAMLLPKSDGTIEPWDQSPQECGINRHYATAEDPGPSADVVYRCSRVACRSLLHPKCLDKFCLPWMEQFTLQKYCPLCGPAWPLKVEHKEGEGWCSWGDCMFEDAMQKVKRERQPTLIPPAQEMHWEEQQSSHVQGQSVEAQQLHLQIQPAETLGGDSVDSSRMLSDLQQEQQHQSSPALGGGSGPHSSQTWSQQPVQQGSSHALADCREMLRSMQSKSEVLKSTRESCELLAEPASSQSGLQQQQQLYRQSQLQNLPLDNERDLLRPLSVQAAFHQQLHPAGTLGRSRTSSSSVQPAVQQHSFQASGASYMRSNLETSSKNSGFQERQPGGGPSTPMSPVHTSSQLQHNSVQKGQRRSRYSDRNISYQYAEIGGRYKCLKPLDNGDICGKTFTRSNDVERHWRRKHEGIKPHCPVCNRGLASKQTLERHLLIFHGSNEAIGNMG